MAAATATSSCCIALIAHDAKKADMVAFASTHKEILKSCKIIATGTTGGRIQEATGLDVECFLSGPLGGDSQIGALVVTKQVQAVLFFVDPLSAHPHEPDVLGLQRLCNVHNIMLGTNIATATVIVKSLYRE